MRLTKEIEKHVDLELSEAGSGQIALCATMCQKSWPPAPNLLSSVQPCSCCRSPSMGPTPAVAFSTRNTFLDKDCAQSFLSA